MARNSFVISKAKGDEAARDLDALFAERGYIIDEVPREIDRLGIDRIFREPTPAGDLHIAVEYKADYRAHTTGSIWLETISVERGNEVQARGWGFTSLSQLIAYYVVGLREVLVFDTLWLKLSIKTFIDMYPEKVVRNPSYQGRGILLPLSEARAIADDIIFYEG